MTLAMAHWLYVGVVGFALFGAGAVVVLGIYAWDHRHDEYDRYGLDKDGRSKWQNRADDR